MEAPPYDPGPPSEGHLWFISFRHQGCYRHRGQYFQAEEESDTNGVWVRAWDIRSAFQKAAELPFQQLMGHEVTNP